MNEPFFWNPLPDAAAWLAQKTGRPIDARTLVDTVAKMGKKSDAPTIIQMVLPKNTKCASLSMFGKPNPLPETDVEKFMRERLPKQFGPLPNGFAYLSEAHPIRGTLCVNNLLELLMYGEVATGLLLDKCQSDGGNVWLMPWGTTHTATMETCGINQADLLALGDKLAAPEQSPATKPAPVVQGGTGTIWTPERKDSARAKMDELRGQGNKAFAKNTAAMFGVTPTRLREVLNDKPKKAPAKKSKGVWDL